VRAVIVSVRGSTVAARYPHSTATESRHVYSVTKSVVSTLVGIALAEGHLRSLDEPLRTLLPGYRRHMSADVAAITLRELMTMTSGLADADQGGAPFQPADSDAVRTILEQGLVAQPGSRWIYSNSAAHLVSAVLRHATGQSVLNYARKRLFDPLGIPSRPAYEGLERLSDPPSFTKPFQQAGFAWATDRQGTHVGGLLLKLTAADMVKLGELHLARGDWHGRRLFPASWIATATTPTALAGDADGSSSYGLMWWLADLGGHPAYAAQGSFGQAIVVVPDLQLVVAVASDDGGVVPLDSAALVPLMAEVIFPAVL